MSIRLGRGTRYSLGTHAINRRAAMSKTRHPDTSQGRTRTSSSPHPTAGRSRTTGMFSLCNCSAGPTPESRRTCGEPMTPPHSKISRLAETANFGPSRVVEICTPTALVAPSLPEVNRTRSVWTEVRMVRLGLWRTSPVRYEVAVELPVDKNIPRPISVYTENLRSCLASIAP